MEKEILVSFTGGKRVAAEYKGFTVATDQPVYQGGEGSAPAPFDLFLISLATCAGFYVLSFIESRGISIEGTKVILKPEIDPQVKMIGKIVIEITVPADFPEKYKNAVIKAVDICTVKKHILDPPDFETVVKFGQ